MNIYQLICYSGLTWHHVIGLQCCDKTVMQEKCSKELHLTKLPFRMPGAYKFVGAMFT